VVAADVELDDDTDATEDDELAPALWVLSSDNDCPARSEEEDIIP